MARSADGSDGPDGTFEAEISRRAAVGRLRHRDLHRLLFEACGTGWEKVRLLALERVALMAPTAATLLHRYAEQQGFPPPVFTEEQRGLAAGPSAMAAVVPAYGFQRHNP
ncbi:hypothetical protein [Streptomyces sp. NPDC002851]